MLAVSGHFVTVARVWCRWHSVGKARAAAHDATVHRAALGLMDTKYQMCLEMALQFWVRNNYVQALSVPV